MAKLKKQQVKQPENAGKETMTLFLEYTVTLMTILLVTFLPLALKNGFYQVGEFKFQVYKTIMIGSMAFIAPMLLLYIIFCRKEIKLSALIKGLSVTDWFVIAYMISTLISYFLNPKYMKDNFWGYPGWYMGLFSQMTFVFLYFIVSRFGKNYKVTLAFFAGTAFITYALAILNRLLIDPLGVYEGLDPKYYYFLSTLGQSSWYAGFLAAFMPFFMGAYLVAENKRMQMVSGILCITGFTTAVSQNSDSTYLALGATYLLLLFIAVSSASRMRRFFELVLGLFLGAVLMRVLTVIHPNEYLTMKGTTTELDKISMFLVFNNKSLLIIPAVLLFVVIFFLIEKKGVYNIRLMCIIRNAIYVLTMVLVLCAIAVLVLGAKNIIPDSAMLYIRKIPYLLWWDNWGNGRGFTWTLTLKMIREFSIVKLLFGTGPDGFSRYGYEFYQSLISSKWGDSVLTNAHNEWLTMTVDGGLIGLTAYLGIFISELVRSIKLTKRIPLLIAFAACITSYVCNNIVDYQNVTCTPFIFLLIGICEWVIKNVESGELGFGGSS